MRSPSHSLRSRFLAAIAAGSALAGATAGGCGGAVEGVPGAGSTSSTSSGGSSGGGSSSGGPTSPPAYVDASAPPAKLDASTACEWGKPQEACYTHEQLEAQYDSPWRGGDATDASPPPWDDSGCLPPEHVRDDCCNVAVSGPTLTASGSCCYVHCTGACCGRPFVVDGAARVATVVERGDWRAPAGGPAHKLAIEALDPGVRARIGRAWINDAAMEHASIAAFARFVLDLLSVGAPADLVLDAQAAMRDEIEHARGCFALASRYAGRPVGPAALDVAGEGGPRSLADVAAAAVTEGCIGETLSSALAEARATGAANSSTRTLLATIAEEEASHAELAWRFVGWAIATGGEPVRAAVARALDASFRRPARVSDEALAGIDPATLRAHGLLDEQAARAVAERTLREIVVPCAARIVGTRRAA
jgi:hypothetical protein